jgi:hypothetical protein
MACCTARIPAETYAVATHSVSAFQCKNNEVTGYFAAAISACVAAGKPLGNGTSDTA